MKRLCLIMLVGYSVIASASQHMTPYPPWTVAGTHIEPLTVLETVKITTALESLSIAQRAVSDVETEIRLAHKMKSNCQKHVFRSSDGKGTEYFKYEPDGCSMEDGQFTNDYKYLISFK